MSYLNPTAVVDPKYPDFAQRTSNVMLVQYSRAFNLRRYVDCFGGVYQDLKDAVTDTISERYPKSAVGEQLSKVAILVGAMRRLPVAKPIGYFGYYDHPQSQRPSVGDDNQLNLGGILRGDMDQDSKDFDLSDAGLRGFIDAKVIKNSSFQTAEDVIAFIETGLQMTLDIETKESTTRNAAEIIIHHSLPIQARVALAATIKMMKAAGVEYTLRDDLGEISLIGQPNTVAAYAKFLESLQL